VDPVTVHPDEKLSHALDLIASKPASAACPSSRTEGPFGILTNRDVRFELNLEQRRARRHDPKARDRPRGNHARAVQGALAPGTASRSCSSSMRPAGCTGSSPSRTLKRRSSTRPRQGRARAPARRGGVGVGSDREERISALLAADATSFVSIRRTVTRKTCSTRWRRRGVRFRAASSSRATSRRERGPWRSSRPASMP